MDLHIDIETFASVDLKKCGAYAYFEAVDFEILLICYAINDGPVQVIDLASGQKMPEGFTRLLIDPKVKKHAHNAAFERNAFRTIGYDVPADQWFCSMVKAAYCGLPLSLSDLSKVLVLGEKGKLSSGTLLINYFCKPCKPSKSNGGRFRNMPGDNQEKWADFVAYCINDVEAERAAGWELKSYGIPTQERELYILDQEINDRGVLIDLEFVKNSITVDHMRIQPILARIAEITGTDNPGSLPQIKAFLLQQTGKDVKSITKDTIPQLIEEFGPGKASEVLELRERSSKTSVKKYEAMQKAVCYDGRVRGSLQYYGANRTGRWAGRLIQLHNLPRNKISNLEEAKELVNRKDLAGIDLLFGNIGDVLSQLIRTAFVAPKGFEFAVADFSAIEARVTAWLALEQWRIDVFDTHGKIYEASASMMFGVPIAEITKGSKLRDRGKVAELALGYQGGVSALKRMGAEEMGLTEIEMEHIKKEWRKKSPAIVKLWSDLNRKAIAAVSNRGKVYKLDQRPIYFKYDGFALMVRLPSGRKLFYHRPRLYINKWKQPALKYQGKDEKAWGWVETYGGKLTENIVQAIARDLLAFSMLNLDKGGFKTVMHVHDEAVAEVPEKGKEEKLKNMCRIMEERPEWAQDLALVADGFLSKFYKKD